MLEKIIKAFKIAIAAVLAITFANVCGLQYAVTSGIITVLSIQNTKRETLKTAKNRALAFACALVIAVICYNVWGFHILAFTIYLFCFALVCLLFKWPEAIAMDSVLITHFLTEQSFTLPLLVNEIGLFVIGTGFGILINLHLRKKEEIFEDLAEIVDEEIKGILHRMALQLEKEDKETYKADCFLKLEQEIAAAKQCALDNWNNSLWDQSNYEINYIKMRENQSRVLENMYRSIKMISALPRQTKMVSTLLLQIEAEYHRNNDVVNLLANLYESFAQMKQEELPLDRKEFEARAVLFYMLKQLEEFLLLKRDFVRINGEI